MADYESKVKITVDDSELDSAKKKIDDLKDKKVKTKIDVDDSGVGKASEGLKKVGQSAKGSSNSVNGLGQSMATVSKNTLAAAAAYKIFNATVKQIKEAVSQVKELNDTMTTVAMTMQDITGGEMSSMKSQILDMSNELSSYVDTVAQAVEIYANANESVSTIMQKSQPTVLLSTAAKMSASDSADTIQGILSQFKLADNQAMHVVDTLEALSSEMRMDFSKGIQDVSEAVKVSGSVIDSAGLSFERYASIVSATAEATRLSGSVLGNAFKSISARIGRSKDGETTSTEKANAEKALSSIGVGIRGVDGDIQDLSITLDSLSQVWGTLTRSQQNYVAEQMAGVRQISTFKAMMDNYNRALELEKTALNSSGTAMKINETRADSIDGKLQKLSATMSKMYNNAVSEDAIKGLLDFANGAANVADKLGLLQGAFSALGVAGLAKGVSLLSANWSTLVSVMTSPVAGIAMGMGAVASAYSAYNNYIKEMIENTRQSADEFATNNASLDEQISKVQELKTALVSGNLSEEESYNVKSQLLDIQNQLVSSYGSQANSVDLVNGSLEKELALMNEISVANANTYLNENEKGITKATDEMAKERYYSFGSIELNENNKSLISDLQDIAKEIDGIDLNANSGNGNMFVEFRGDTVKAKDSIDEYMTRVRQLKSEMEANGQDTSALDTLLQQASGELAKNQEILDNYQEIYNKSLQADMISKGFGSDKPATIYNDYAKAIQEYNDALLSGDDSKIADAKTKFDEVQSSVDGVIEKYPEYTSLFDEVGSALDTASVSANNFKNALKLDDMSDTVKSLKDLKDVDLKSMNFNDDVTSDSEDALSKIVDKAIELGIVSDDSSESIAEVVDILVQLGYVSSDSSSGIEKVTQSMADLTEKTQGVVNDINAVMGVLSGQQTGKSISLADFNSDELKDYQSALEYVNGSMQLNAEKVQEITKAKADETIAINENNKALKQAEYLKNAGEIEELRSELRGLTEGTQEYNDVEMRLQSLMSSNEAISAECDQYDLLTATIKEATSAYNKWLIAQSGGDYGDMFNDSLDAYARIMNTYNSKSDIYGDFGSKKFDAAVDFIVPDTVDTEDADAIKSYMDSFKQYLTFDDNGDATGMNIEQFCKNAMDKGLMVLDEAGENYQIAGETTMEDFANGLNMSLPMVQAFFDELQLKGGEFDWADEAIKTVGDLGVKAYESAEALRSIEGNSDLEIKMDVSGMDNLDDKLSTLDGTIQHMNELKAQPDVDASQIEYANDIIQYCVAQKQKLSEPVFMTIDTSQVDGELGEVIGLIQQLQSAKNELDIQASVGADTTEAQGKVDNLVAQIQNKDATIKATIGDVDTSNVDTILAGISQKSAQAWVTLGVKDEAIAGYVPENKTATVTYKLDSYAVDSYNPKNLRRTVTYTVVTKGDPPKVNGTAHAEGTAHMSGTVRSNRRIGEALASGDWGVSKNETALVGELGQELIVYGNRYWTVGDNGAEFTHIPKGAIVFNHKQTEEIFRNGYVTSGGGRGHSYASGTAYVSGGISVSNAKTGSYSSSGSSKKKTTTSKTKSSTEDALDAISNYFDWVKVRFDRLARETEIAEDAIENAIGLQAKQSATSKAIAKVKAEMDVARQGYNTYLAHANKVASELGLSSDLQKKVQNGTIDITQYDEDTKKRIEEYRSAYEDALDALDKVRELQDKERELAQQRLENIEDFYNLVNDISNAMKSANDAKLEFDAAKGYSAVSDSVRKVYEDSLEQTREIYANNLKQLEEYQSEFQSLMDQGYFKKGSDAYYKAVAKIYEFNEAISKAGTAIIEFEDKIRDIEYTKIQYIIDGFERAVDKLDAQISLMKARNEKVPESIYQKQIDSNNQRIQANKDMRDAKLAEQAYYDVDSERYQEIADEINKLDIETLGLMEDNEKLKDSIYELRFEALDEGIEKSRALRDEINDIRDLMNEDSFFDKDGKITESGLANIALLEQGIAAAKKEIADYRVGLEKLQESYDNGVISETEYNEKSEEYRKGIRESVKDVQDYTESLTDLYITQMSKENESLKKSIQLRIKALEAKESYYEYDKKIRSQSKDVNALRSEIAALEGVNNSQAKARLKQLKQQLADAEDTLNETKRSHSVEMQKDGYSEMINNLDENLENLEYEVSHNADKQQEIIQSMLNSVVNMYETAYGKINKIISDTGLSVSEGFEQNQSQLSTQSGTESQVAEATKTQSNVQANDSASNTVTNPINSNDSTNKQIESEITADVNTDNRLCAELTVNITSVTLEEGKSVSVSTSIRPSDAKNKTLSWKSSNTSVATVSGGTIKAVSHGACQVVVSTTDGSGLSQSIGVTVTKKPEPPKQQNSSSQSNGGDGAPKVGDMVTFASGSYYYDSEGVKPVGSQHQGQKVYITKINTASWATKPYHISTGNKLGSGDLGWVTLNQIKGYARGSKYINGKRWALTQENGQELIARLSDGSLLTPLGNGDKVFTKEQTDKLWEMSKGLDSKFINLNTSNVIGSLPNIVNRNEMSQKTEVNLNFDTLMTIEGNVYKDAIPGLQKEIDKMIPHISDKLAIYIKGDLRKL